VPEDRNLFPSNTFVHRLDQLVEIGNELVHRHRGFGDLAVERLAATALIPVDDSEGFLERRIEVSEEMSLGEARPAVQEDQWRIVEVLATNQHPLIEPTEIDVVSLSDAVRKDSTLWTAMRWRFSWMFHVAQVDVVWLTVPS